MTLQFITYKLSGFRHKQEAIRISSVIPLIKGTIRIWGLGCALSPSGILLLGRNTRHRRHVQPPQRLGQLNRVVQRRQEERRPPGVSRDLLLSSLSRWVSLQQEWTLRRSSWGAWARWAALGWEERRRGSSAWHCRCWLRPPGYTAGWVR